MSNSAASPKTTFRRYDDAVRDELLGPKGSTDRDAYEFELSLELLAERIKALRKARNLTQAELGTLIGCQKSQISKLENNAATLTVATLLAIARALGTTIRFHLDTEELALPAA